jgi:hypothetical protein
LSNGIYTIKFDFDSGSLIQKLVIIRWEILSALNFIRN